MKLRATMTAAVLSAATLSISANAAPYTLSASGTVQTITRSANGSYTAYSGGKISNGDTFSVTATFDPTVATVSPYTNEPTYAIYALNGAKIVIGAGTYLSSFSPTDAELNATAQLWNNRDIGIGMPIDSQSFSFFNYNYGGPYPYDLATGPVLSELLSLQSFDFSSLARNSTSINELIPSSTAFNSNSLSYSFGSSATDGSTIETILVNVGNVSYTLLPLAAAVPEPGTWMMLILGFGAIGWTLRRRQLGIVTRVRFA